VILTFEEKELIKTMCDLFVRANGISQIKKIVLILEHIKQDDCTFTNMEEIKFIEQLCDTTMRSTGISSLESVVKLLNKIVSDIPKKA